MTASALLVAAPAAAQLATVPGEVLIRRDQGLLRLEVEVPRIREALPVLDVGGFVTDLVVDAGGDLILSTGSQVSRYDVETGSIEVLAAYQAIWRHRVLPAPDGRLLTLAWLGGSSNPHPTVREIDTAGAVRVLGTINLCALPPTACPNDSETTGAALDTDGTILAVVASSGPQGIVRFDPADGWTYSAIRFASIDQPKTLVRDDDGTWLVSTGRSLWRVDLATGEETLLVERLRGIGGFEMERRGDGQVVIQRQDGILLVDPRTGRQRFVPTLQAPIAVVPGTPAPPACSNGIDDDGDGEADYPRDFGCTTPFDGTEQPACDDGLDNDGDGLVDLDDPGCAGRNFSQQESPACSDGIDNDGDGFFDHPDDPECLGPADDNEAWAPHLLLRWIYGSGS